MSTPGGARALGYRLLGPAFDYILHLRPAEWPIMAGHTLLGALLALGLPAVTGGAPLGRVLLGLVLWVVALNGGTLAINSAFDRDEGDVREARQHKANDQQGNHTRDTTSPQDSIHEFE